jgi:predicted ATPase
VRAAETGQLTLQQGHRILVTGGPGAGKTTLLEALSARGYLCVADNARAIIRERKRLGLAPRPEPVAFARETLRRDIAAYRNAPAAQTAFFERGVPDALGMLAHCGALGADELQQHLSEFPYARRALLLPPWEQIYTTDDERDQSYAEAVRVSGLACDWYTRCGYDLVEVPRLPVNERCDFVLRTLATH